MNFELSDEQQQLADSVGKFLTTDYSFEKRQAIVRSDTGCSDAVWSTFADMGLTAIALPEADGGFDGGAMDLMATMEACGEAHVVEPLLDNIAFGGRLVSRAGCRVLSMAADVLPLPALNRVAATRSRRPTPLPARKAPTGFSTVRNRS